MFYKPEIKRIRKSRKIDLTKRTGHIKLDKQGLHKKPKQNSVVGDYKLYKR